jgi:hypothetical protein
LAESRIDLKLEVGTPTPVFRMALQDVRRNGWILFHAHLHRPSVPARPGGSPDPWQRREGDLVPVIGAAW